MVDAIATDPKYVEFEAKHNRHLNMLAENVSRTSSRVAPSDQRLMLCRTATSGDRPSSNSTRSSTPQQSLTPSSSSTIVRSWCGA